MREKVTTVSTTGCIRPTYLQRLQITELLFTGYKINMSQFFIGKSRLLEVKKFCMFLFIVVYTLYIVVLFQ